MTRWCIPSIPFVVIPSDSEESIMDASLRCASFSMTAAFVIASTLLSFRAIARKPVWMLHCVQHDKVVLFQAFPLLSFRAIARKPVWMLHFANASFSMTRWCIPSIPFVVIPSDSEESIMDASLRCASFSMTRWCIPSIPFVVIPSDSEESIMDASLRCAVQHDKVVLFQAFPLLSFRAIARKPVWMLHCVQHDKVVHSKHSLCCHSER